MIDTFDSPNFEIYTGGGNIAEFAEIAEFFRDLYLKLLCMRHE
jgi:hypothetical protein